MMSNEFNGDCFAIAVKILQRFVKSRPVNKRLETVIHLTKTFLHLNEQAVTKNLQPFL